MGNSHNEPGAAADRGFVTLPIRQEQLTRINLADVKLQAPRRCKAAATTLAELGAAIEETQHYEFVAMQLALAGQAVLRGPSRRRRPSSAGDWFRHRGGRPVELGAHLKCAELENVRARCLQTPC
jgi:hypothetical protein